MSYIVSICELVDFICQPVSYLTIKQQTYWLKNLRLFYIYIPDPIIQPNRMSSVHSAQILDVHEMPMDVIIRPIPPVLDENKLNSIMDSIKVCYFKLNSQTRE